MLRKFTQLLLVGLVMVPGGIINAQQPSGTHITSYDFTQSTPGFFEQNGVVSPFKTTVASGIGAFSNTSYAFYLPTGFSYTFNGTTYVGTGAGTTGNLFLINTNGWIGFNNNGVVNNISGPAASTTTPLTTNTWLTASNGAASSATNQGNGAIFSAMGRALVGNIAGANGIANGSECYVVSYGDGRIVVEWRNIKPSAGVAGRIDYEFIIYPNGYFGVGSKARVEYRYANCSYTGTASTAQVGARGWQGFADDQMRVSTTSWSATTLGAPYSSTGTTIDLSSTVLPATGQSFMYSPCTSTPSYATLPYTQGFESTWINSGCGSGIAQDIPDNSWRAGPLYGETSWRRNGAESTAFWSNIGLGTPAAGYSGTGYANFHTYAGSTSNSGQIGVLDLFVSASAGSNTLEFDAQNTSGTDVIRVRVSTDGGLTFPTLLTTVGVNATWTHYNLSFTGSTTCVIRFEGTGDWGVTDMGIDNVTVTPPAVLDDAGITAISPFCSGLQNVYVTVKNYGLSTLNTVNVNWSVNGTPQPVMPLSGLGIPSGGTSVQMIGTYTFIPATSYTILASTSLPNGSVDPVTSNDSYTSTTQAGLSGTYTVGAGGSFTTLTAAVAAYNSNGICGPTVFSLTNASYNAGETFPITINATTGSSSTNTLTIRPAAGVSPTITTAATGTTLKLNGADYVIIDGSNSGTASRDLTISNTLSGTSAIIWIGSASASNAATNNAIQNCNITGLSTTGTTVGILAGSSGSLGTAADAPNSNNTILNNRFTKAQNAMFLYGNAAMDQNWVIRKNSIGSASVTADKMGFRGVFLANAQNFTINKDTINGIVTSTATFVTGLQIYGNISNGNITQNLVSDITNTAAGGFGAEGIYLSASTTSSNVLVANNFISNVSGLGWSGSTFYDDNGYGILMDLGGGYKIYHNTINLTTNQTTGISAAINVNSGLTAAASVDIVNNIIVTNQTAGGSRYALYSTAAASVFNTINYNDYYTAAGGVLGNIGGTDRTTIPQMQAGFGGNVNSLFTSPVFISATDMHLQTDANCGLDAAGTPIAAVTVDIDSAARSGSNPDIGADEFTSNFLVDAGTDQSICSPASVTLAGNTLPLGGNGLWTILAGTATFGSPGANNSSVTGYTSGGFTNIYTWTVTSGSCGGNDNVNVVVNDGPSISVDPANQQPCAGSPFSLSVTASSAGGYQWYQGVTPISISNPYSVAAAVPGDAGTYYVVVNGIGGCSAVTATSGTATVTVNGSGQWLGTTSSDWSDGTNWCGGVPTATTDVLIPNVPTQPIVGLSTTADARDIHLNNGTTLDVAGIFNLHGDMTHDGIATFTANPGTFNLAGTGTQNVDLGFYAINMGVTGSGDKNFTEYVFIGNNLSLGIGNIALTGSYINLQLSSGATITGYSPTHYIKTSGTGTALVQEVGATPVTFPVGDANYNPVTMNNTGTTDNFRIHVRDEVLVGGTTGMQVDNSTTYVINHTFDIEEEVLGGSLANITIQWGAGEENTGLFQYNHAYIAHFYDNDGAGPNPAEWHHDDIPYSSMAPAAGGWPGPGPYTATTSNVTTFSPFAIGSNGGSAPLHVQLTDVSAVNEGAKNKVEWHSAVEDGLDHYEVERSTDGQNFSHMADVAAAGHAFGYLTYDNSPNPGLTYYRLKLVEQDGSSSYSQIVHAFMKVGNEVAVAVYPNPVSDVLHVEVYGATDDNATVTLTDLSGKVISPVTLHNGQAEINMSSLSSGVYFVKFSGNGLNQSIKVNKQ